MSSYNMEPVEKEGANGHHDWQEIAIYHPDAVADPDSNLKSKAVEKKKNVISD